MSLPLAFDIPGTFATSEEFSCPCCGTPTDSSYCEPCDAAECGEAHYRSASPCMVEMRAKGFTVVGTSVEPVQLKDRTIPLCRVEILKRPDGTHSYGRVLEVLS